jgi:hypothetical protein
VCRRRVCRRKRCVKITYCKYYRVRIRYCKKRIVTWKIRRISSHRLVKRCYWATRYKTCIKYKFIWRRSYKKIHFFVRIPRKCRKQVWCKKLISFTKRCHRIKCRYFRYCKYVHHTKYVRRPYRCCHWKRYLRSYHVKIRVPYIKCHFKRCHKYVKICYKVYRRVPRVVYKVERICRYRRCSRRFRVRVWKRVICHRIRCRRVKRLCHKIVSCYRKCPYRHCCRKRCCILKSYRHK